jgi:hypothetical protein
MPQFLGGLGHRDGSICPAGMRFLNYHTNQVQARSNRATDCASQWQHTARFGSAV